MKNDFIKNKNTYNQPKKAIKKTFSFYALVFALLFMFFGSILGTIAFVRTSTSESSNNIAYADSVSDFWVYTGSDLIYPLNTFSRNGAVFGNLKGTNNRYLCAPITFGITLEKSYAYNVLGDYYVSNVPSISFEWLSCLDMTNISNTFVEYVINGTNTILYSSYTANGSKPFLSGTNESDPNTNLPNQTFYNDDTVIKSRYTFGVVSSLSSNNTFWGDVYTTTTYGFNCNVQKVEIYSSVPTFDGDYASFSNYIKYTDDNSKTFLIEMPLTVWITSTTTNYYPNVGAYKFEPRTYYTQGGFSGEISEQLKQQAQVISERYEDQIQALKIQYQNQLQDAVSTARQQGYNEGISNNDTTFLSLFGALFDAPIQALSGLLNFDILGFNLWNFFTAIITVAIVIFAVRLFL